MNLTKEHIRLLFKVLDKEIDKTKNNISIAMSHKDSTIKDYEDQVDILKDLRYIKEIIKGDINV